MDELEGQLQGLIDQLEPFLDLERKIDTDLFQELSTSQKKIQVAAVDGSHRLLLDGRSFHILALRGGHVLFDGPGQKGTFCPLHLQMVNRENLPEILKRQWARLRESLDLPDFITPHMELSTAAERLRELLEWEAAAEAMARLDEGDLLLVDGSLHNPTKLGQQVLMALGQRAEEMGIGLMGVSKRSALSLASMPLLPALERTSRVLNRESSWSYPITKLIPVRSTGEALAFRFNGHAPVFRVDIAGALEPDYALANMLPYCRDILYPGYPYPLAQVHNEVFLGAQEGRDLIQKLQSRALSHGLPTGAWQVLFADFHEVLDRSV